MGGGSSRPQPEPYKAYGNQFRTRTEMVAFLNNDEAKIKEYDELYRLYMNTLENPPEDVVEYTKLFNEIKSRGYSASAAGRKKRRSTRSTRQSRKRSSRSLKRQIPPKV